MRSDMPGVASETVTAYFEELRGPLLRYLTSLGLPVQDSEEVLQETFLALYEHLDRGKPQNNLRGWIFRVAHNQGLKRRQANGRHLRLVTAPGNETERFRAGPPSDPETQAARRQRRERVMAIVGSLPELDRRCLCLRAEGLRYREIARTLGISLGGVALSLKRSLSALIPTGEE
jgi:RNA polymerase sigma-70 factor (ECF subfamily)